MQDVFLQGKWYTNIPDEVADYMQAQNDALEFVYDKIRTVRVKHNTAVAKPRKAFRLAHYQAVQELYNLIPEATIKQGELLK